MQFYFIRHAQSENNALWERTNSPDGRSEDPQLTETGRRQARLLAQFLRDGNPDPRRNGRDLGCGFGITHLYSSLMVRAVATGTAVSQAIGVPLEAWIDIHEEGGIYLDDAETGEPKGLPGKKRHFFEQHYPELVLPAEWNSGGWWDRPFEADEIRPARARQFLADLLGRHGDRDDRVAVISHGGFYNQFLRALLKLSQENELWFTMYNTGITRIDFHHDAVELVYQNRVDFLPENLVT